MKVQGKLNMHVISESVLMLMTENYQNWSMFVEAIHLAKVGAFFLPRDAMQARSMLSRSVCLSVRPSVPPSVCHVRGSRQNE